MNKEAYEAGAQFAIDEVFSKEAAKKRHKLEPGSFKGPSEPASSAPKGEGGRFKALEAKLEKKSDIDEIYEKIAKKIRDPGALAASIGRAKFGKKKFQEMAAAGKK